ncbi:hypothetical protein [Vibrio sp. TBV020]
MHDLTKRERQDGGLKTYPVEPGQYNSIYTNYKQNLVIRPNDIV